MKKKTSPIWTTPREQMAQIVKSNSTLAGIIRAIGINNSAGAYEPLKLRLTQDQIDFSHIPLGLHSGKGRAFGSHPKRPLDQVLVEYSAPYSSRDLKNRLIKELNWPYLCQRCGVGNTWNNKPLVLQLDHINGHHTDNRLDNLRLLCPNCHSQTSTFTGRNRLGKRNPARVTCTKCGCACSPDNKHKMCMLCFRKYILPDLVKHTTKVPVRPSKENILQQVEKLGYKATGQLYQVCGNTVKRWLLDYGVVLQPRPRGPMPK